ncbi:MAG: MFS transporter [Pseudomonadota bacterium]
MPSSDKSYPYQAFGVCLLMYAMSQMDLALFAYAVPSIKAEFGLTQVGIMSIVSSAFLLAAVGIVWLGWLTDRLGRKGMFQFSLIGSSILVTLHSIVPNPGTLVLLRGSSLAVGGLTYPITGSILAEEFPAKIRGFFLGLLQIGYPLGWVFASWWAAWLLADYGWRVLFLVGLASLPLVLLVHWKVREPPRFVASKTQGERPRLSELLGPGIRRRALLLFAAQFLFVSAYAGSVFNFPSYLMENRGLEIPSYSKLIGYGHLIGILGYIAAAFVGEFVITRRNTVVIWTLLGALMFQIMIWRTDSYGELLVMYGLTTMFFYGSAAVKFAYLAEVFPTRLRATAMATCGSFAVILGSAVGPLLVAFFERQYGWNVAFALIVGIPLFLAGLLYMFLIPVPSGLEVEEVDNYLKTES